MVKDQARIGKGPSLEEKLGISARAAVVLFEEKGRLTAEEMGGRLGVPAEVLRSMAKRRRNWSGWPPAMRFEDDVFSMAPGWRWFEAAVIRATGEIIRVEDGRGERVDLPDTGGAFLSLLPGDRVLAAQDNGGCGYAVMLAFLEQPARRVVCTVSRGAVPARDKSWHLPVSSRFFESVISCSNLSLPAPAVPEEGLRVVVEAEPRPAGIPCLPRGRVVEVLGPASSPGTELKIAVEEHGLRREFPAEALAQAEGLPDDPPGEEACGRVDLRDIAFVTVDGEDARDFDDAVYCCSRESGWRLLVAIADVSRYVTEGSPLDIEAQQRGTSAYFPSCVIPMLPEKLSNGLCSLNPGADRAVMVCDMVIGRDGKTEAYQFYPGMIHSHARLTYSSVWEAIQGRDGDFLARGGSREDLEVLCSLYRTLRKAREKRGAIDFEIAETEVRTGSDGLVETIARREHNDAHRIIEECMLAANVCAADFVSRHRHPCLYRIHEEPSPERLFELRSVLLTLGCRLDGGARPSASDFRRVLDAIDDESVSGAVQAAMLRSMPRAAYSPENCGHYGLAYPAYTHFTSPIRRYPDLLVHRTIRAIAAGGRYVPAVYPAVHPLSESSDGRRLLGEDAARSGEVPPGTAAGGWKELGLLCSAAERRADSASRDVVAWLKCRFASGLAGKRFDGTVTGTNRAGLFVSLDSPFIEGFVHVSRIGGDYYDYEAGRGCFTGRSGGGSFGIGRRVRVEVEAVDAEMRRIDFRIVGSCTAAD